MGCKAVTPHLVSLAKRLEGKPFHLVLSHCQNNSKENVVSYLKSQGLEADTPNVTLTSFGRHPKVKGNGYVPYYMLFDHRGKLFFHHMTGDYHGGNGLKVIEQVDELLRQIMPVDVGDQPFKKLGREAKEIAYKHKLARNIAKLEGQLPDEEDAETKAEIERLLAAVAAYRDRSLQEAAALRATAPSRMEETLEDLAKELKRTELGQLVSDRLDALDDDEAFQRDLKVEKELNKLKASLKKRSARTIERARKKAQELLEDSPQTELKPAIEEFVESLS